MALEQLPSPLWPGCTTVPACRDDCTWSTSCLSEPPTRVLSPCTCIDFHRFPVGHRASQWLQPGRDAGQRPLSAREAARGTCSHRCATQGCFKDEQRHGAPTPYVTARRVTFITFTPARAMQRTDLCLIRGVGQHLQIHCRCLMGAVCADKCQSYSEPRNPTQAVRALLGLGLGLTLRLCLRCCLAATLVLPML